AFRRGNEGPKLRFQPPPLRQRRRGGLGRGSFPQRQRRHETALHAFDGGSHRSSNNVGNEGTLGHSPKSDTSSTLPLPVQREGAVIELASREGAGSRQGRMRPSGFGQKVGRSGQEMSQPRLESGSRPRGQPARERGGL